MGFLGAYDDEARARGMTPAAWREKKEKILKREKEDRDHYAAERAAQEAADRAIGLRSATELEIARGAPPKVFDNLPTDNEQCKLAKSRWNLANRDAFDGPQFANSGFSAAVARVGLYANYSAANNAVNQHCRDKDSADARSARMREKYASSDGKFRFREACDKLNKEKAEKSRSGFNF